MGSHQLKNNQSTNQKKKAEEDHVLRMQVILQTFVSFATDCLPIIFQSFSIIQQHFPRNIAQCPSLALGYVLFLRLTFSQDISQFNALPVPIRVSLLSIVERCVCSYDQRVMTYALQLLIHVGILHCQHSKNGESPYKATMASFQTIIIDLLWFTAIMPNQTNLVLISDGLLISIIGNPQAFHELERKTAENIALTSRFEPSNVLSFSHDRIKSAFQALGTNLPSTLSFTQKNQEIFRQNVRIFLRHRLTISCL